MRLDDLLIILQNIVLLINSKKNIHIKNALNTGLNFLKIVSEVKLYLYKEILYSEKHEF